MRRIRSPCCARAASGHAAAAPPRSVMNSRRRIVAPELKTGDRSKSLTVLGWHQADGRTMSALAQKQTLQQVGGMSALPPEADMCVANTDVR